MIQPVISRAFGIGGGGGTAALLPRTLMSQRRRVRSLPV
jgi:hypothetical protein